MVVPLAVLLIILGVGCHFGLPIYRQAAAIRAIEDVGGKVAMRHGGPDWLRSWVGDEWMRPFDYVRGINLCKTRATDEDLARLSQVERLKCMEFIYLCDNQITDAGLVHLKHLPNLNFLQ